jgi:hypothetical protein
MKNELTFGGRASTTATQAPSGVGTTPATTHTLPIRMDSNVVVDRSNDEYWYVTWL